MKTFITAILLAITSTALANLGTPSSTVEAVIRHAQDGQIVAVDLVAISKHKKHSHSKESLLNLLQGIEPEKLVFQAMDKEKNIFWFPDKDTPNKSLVRLLEPRSLDFEVIFVRDDAKACGGYYEVTSVHP